MYDVDKVDQLLLQLKACVNRISMLCRAVNEEDHGILGAEHDKGNF